MKKSKPQASFRDSRGNLLVDCAECERGGNGKRDCSAGWQHKRRKKGACFSGTLLEKYQEI